MAACSPACDHPPLHRWIRTAAAAGAMQRKVLPRGLDGKEALRLPSATTAVSQTRADLQTSRSGKQNTHGIQQVATGREGVWQQYIVLRAYD